jgi:hypothetical protein
MAVWIVLFLADAVLAVVGSYVVYRLGLTVWRSISSLLAAFDRFTDATGSGSDVLEAPGSEPAPEVRDDDVAQHGAVAKRRYAESRRRRIRTSSAGRQPKGSRRWVSSARPTG